MSDAPGASSPARSGFSPAVWEEAGWLGCELSVELPVHAFTARDLLQLAQEAEFYGAMDGAARFHLRRLLEPFLPRVVVLSPTEIPPGISVQSLGVVR